MTIQDLGSIGELIAAIATVATLGYLALQIRQNTRVLRGTFHDSHIDRMQAWQLAVANDPDLSSIWLRSRQGAELSSEENARLAHLRMYFIIGTESLYYQHSRGNIDPELWSAGLARVRRQLAQPEFRRWWREERDFTLTEAFESLMESEITTIEQRQ